MNGETAVSKILAAAVFPLFFLFPLNKILILSSFVELQLTTSQLLIRKLIHYLKNKSNDKDRRLREPAYTTVRPGLPQFLGHKKKFFVKYQQKDKRIAHKTYLYSLSHEDGGCHDAFVFLLLRYIPLGREIKGSPSLQEKIFLKFFSKLVKSFLDKFLYIVNRKVTPFMNCLAEQYCQAYFILLFFTGLA